jgi:hypothetical protein
LANEMVQRTISSDERRELERAAGPAPRSEGLVTFLTFAATPSPFLALRAEGGWKLSDADGRAAERGPRVR